MKIIKNTLLMIAISLLFVAPTIESISVDAIVKATGVTPKSVYLGRGYLFAFNQGDIFDMGEFIRKDFFPREFLQDVLRYLDALDNIPYLKSEEARELDIPMDRMDLFIASLKANIQHIIDAKTPIRF